MYLNDTVIVNSKVTYRERFARDGINAFFFFIDVNRSKLLEKPTGKPEELTVLRNEVKELQCSIGMIMVQLTEEKMARSTLQNILRNYLTKEADKIQWPKTT